MSQPGEPAPVGGGRPAPRPLRLDQLDELPAGVPILLHVGQPEALPGIDIWPLSVDPPFPGVEALEALLFRPITAWLDPNGVVTELLRHLGTADRTLQLDVRRVLVPEFLPLHVQRHPAAALQHMNIPLFLEMLDGSLPYPMPGTDHNRFSHAQLIRMRFEAQTFLVADVFPAEGLALLAGRPKLGKSWMALQLASSVASGSPFLERPVKQAPVLALMLEDTARRLQQRLAQQRSDHPLPIEYRLRFPKLNSASGIEELARAIESCQPGLVLIDTVASAVSGAFVENDAGPVNAVLNPLRELAQDRHVLIVAILHHGKLSQGDALLDIRGSSAFAGAADVILGLYREENGCVLRADGRDIERQEIRVSFDGRRTFSWQLVRDAKQQARAETETAVLSALDARGGRGTVEQLAAATHSERSTVQKQLKRMCDEGKLDRQRSGESFVYFRVSPGGRTENGCTPPTPCTPPSKPVHGVQAVQAERACNDDASRRDPSGEDGGGRGDADERDADGELAFLRRIPANGRGRIVPGCRRPGLDAGDVCCLLANWEPHS